MNEKIKATYVILHHGPVLREQWILKIAAIFIYNRILVTTTTSIKITCQWNTIFLYFHHKCVIFLL